MGQQWLQVVSEETGADWPRERDRGAGHQVVLRGLWSWGGAGARLSVSLLPLSQHSLVPPCPCCPLLLPAVPQPLSSAQGRAEAGHHCFSLLRTPPDCFSPCPHRSPLLPASFISISPQAAGLDCTPHPGLFWGTGSAREHEKTTTLWLGRSPLSCGKTFKKLKTSCFWKSSYTSAPRPPDQQLLPGEGGAVLTWEAEVTKADSRRVMDFQQCTGAAVAPAHPGVCERLKELASGPHSFPSQTFSASIPCQPLQILIEKFLFL